MVPWFGYVVIKLRLELWCSEWRDFWGINAGRYGGIKVPKFTGNVDRILQHSSSTMVQLLTELDRALSTTQNNNFLSLSQSLGRY